MNKIATYFLRASLFALSMFSFSQPSVSANLAFMQDTAGQYFNSQDWELFGVSVQQALNTKPNGRSEVWRNPNTGSGGTLMPINSMKKNGTICRNLQITNRSHHRADQYVFMYCKYRSGWKIQQ